MRVSRILEQMRVPVAQLLNSKALRKLAQSLGPYCLAAAILPGGTVLVPLLFLFRRRKAAVLRITDSERGTRRKNSTPSRSKKGVPVFVRQALE